MVGYKGLETSGEKMVKKCTKCGKKYPATKEFFTSDKRNKNGLQARCRKCTNIAAEIWQKRNKKRYKSNQKKYHQKNKEYLNNYGREYYRTTIGYVHCLMSSIKARCTNPETHNYKNYGGRGIQYCFTFNELLSWLTTNNIDPRGLNIHRIDNDGNYTLDNIEFLDKNNHMRLHKL